MKRTSFSTIDEYIESFPGEVRVILQQVRQTIQAEVPGSEEAISYQIPAFRFNERVLIYFAAFKNHISIYPAPRGEPEFQKELTQYKGGKGTVQFPLAKPIPYDLIRRIVRFKSKKTSRMLPRKPRSQRQSKNE